MWNYNYELYHAGTKGMKWGQRLYQNKDGSLTPLGRLRYGNPKNYRAKTKAKERAVAAKKAEKAKLKAEEAATKAELEKRTKMGSKSVKAMTESELKEFAARLTLEKNVSQLKKDVTTLNPEKVSLGKKMVSAIGSKVIGPAALESGKHLLTKFLKDGGDQMIDKMLGNDKKDSMAELEKQAKKTKLEMNISENVKKKLIADRDYAEMTSEGNAKNKKTKTAFEESREKLKNEIIDELRSDLLVDDD